MNHTHKYSLINEVVGSEDARELLLTLLSGTSSFHSLKNLRSWETRGATDAHLEQRMDQLELLRENLMDLLRDGNGDFSVQIHAEIKAAPNRN